MKARILRALKAYFAITLVMLLNIALAIAVLRLVVPRGPAVPTVPTVPSVGSWREIPGLRKAEGDTAVVRENLTLLNTLHHLGLHADLRAILEYCGAPEAYHGDIQSDLELIYPGGRVGEKGWVTQASLKGGFLVGLSYMEPHPGDLTGFKRWDIPDGEIPTYR